MLSRLLTLVVVASLAGVGPAAAASRDAKAPRITFATQSGDVLVGAPAESDVSTVRGSVTDKRSGTKRVRVTYCSGGMDDDGGWTCGGTAGAITTVDARLECAAPSHRSCLWSAAAPTRPGSYLVFVRARDRAGNVSSAGPIEVLVA